MMIARASPGVLRGALAAPPSKSYTHRALIAGHLAARRYRVDRPLDADDTRATARAVAALGTPVQRGIGAWTLGPPAERPSGSVTVDCGESGTTLRFVAALAATRSTKVRLVGRGRLPNRPIEELLHALERLGARVERPARGGGLPVSIRGPIRGGHLRLDASRSSQFASALLLVLPSLADDSELELDGTIVSEPYLDATVAVLRSHGIRIVRRGRHFSIPGGQRYRGAGFAVPGDASSAAYFWVGAAISGGEVRITRVPSDWPQADLAILDLLERAGARVLRTRRAAAVRGGHLRRFRFDLTRSPDLYPLAGVLAAAIPGVSHLRGAAQVAWKESDRRAETIRLAEAMGAVASDESGGLAIRGVPRPQALGLTNLADHRLVMSAAIAALVADGPSRIGDADAVRKSFPEFWSTLRSVRKERRP